MASAVPVHAGSRSRIVILRLAGHAGIATACAATPAPRPPLQTIMTLTALPGAACCPIGSKRG